MSKNKSSRVDTPIATEMLIRGRLHLWYKREMPSWKKAKVKLKEITGVEMPVERLRQTVMPVSDVKKRDSSFPKERKRVEALKKLLVESNYALEEELEDPTSQGYLPVAMQNLITGSAKAPYSAVREMAGRYFLEEIGLEQNCLTQIDIQFDHDFEWSYLFITKIYESIHSDDDEVILFDGWMVCTGEEPAFFAAQSRNGESVLFYHVVGVDPKTTNAQSTSSIALMSIPGNSSIKAGVNEYGEQVHSLENNLNDSCIFLTRMPDDANDITKSQVVKLGFAETKSYLGNIRVMEFRPEDFNLPEDYQPGDSADLVFIKLVQSHYLGEALKVLPYVSDVNVRHPVTHSAAIHYAASGGCKSFISRMEEKQEVDYTMRSGKNFFPFDLAMRSNHFDLAEELMDKADKQCASMGSSFVPNDVPLIDL